MQCSVPANVLAAIGHSSEVQNCLKSNNGKLPYLQVHAILREKIKTRTTNKQKNPTTQQPPTQKNLHQQLQGFTEDYYTLNYNMCRTSHSQGQFAALKDMPPHQNSTPLKLLLFTPPLPQEKGVTSQEQTQIQLQFTRYIFT